MASITLRYRDDLEPTLEKLKEYYIETTKNKAIVTALENHLPLIEKLEKAKIEINTTEDQYAKLQELITAKMKADDILKNFISSIK